MNLWDIPLSRRIVFSSVSHPFLMLKSARLLRSYNRLPQTINRFQTIAVRGFSTNISLIDVAFIIQINN